VLGQLQMGMNHTASVIAARLNRPIEASLKAPKVAISVLSKSEGHGKLPLEAGFQVAEHRVNPTEFFGNSLG